LIRDISKSFDGEVQKIDGSQLELNQLPELLMGTSLFSQSRLIIVKDLSENKSLWADFGKWLERLSDDIELVLVETKPDKRTATYKDLKSKSKVVELPTWPDRDTLKAETWLQKEAELTGVELNKKIVQYIVRRVGVNQWDLAQALDKLALVDEISTTKIDDIIDANPSENVFNLFETALRGDKARLSDLLKILEKTEDPFKLFALLSGQAFQLAVMANSEASDNPEKDFGLHPFVAKKLSSVASKLGKSGARKVAAVLAEADDDMKLSVAEPWVLIERALVKIANI
jgi:DNA polymerase III delta subunit